MDQPSIGRIVLVKHKTPVNGQHESAAIITQVVQLSGRSSRSSLSSQRSYASP